jgi:cyclopropane fatty-acyl-phospholipid synthase-like methyltransferase
MVKDYRDLMMSNVKYDSISCLEMAEHVGIMNFQPFLQQVKSMLKPNGVFYLQIAGLRRWGVFMGKYVFPGADASCPLGFVTSHLERAGWEVNRVNNKGAHYGRTIKMWYDNWLQNEDDVVQVYGSYWFKLWSVFLFWSSLIAKQGSSTIFMITSTKNHKNDTESVSHEYNEINRSEMTLYKN